MTVSVADILAAIDELAPFELAEEWDNVGLQVGFSGGTVSSIMVGLDPTNDLLDEVLESGADTLITHHPLIFKPFSAVITDQPEGEMLERVIRHKITVIGCHTNLDNAVGGVNDVLAEWLGLEELQPLIPFMESGRSGAGTGRIGQYDEGISKDLFMERLLNVLGLSEVQVAGVLPERIRKVGLCGGSGSGFAQVAMAGGADLYLSAEIKHSTARWAEQSGFCVIDGTHYGTERPVVDYLAEKLGEYCKAKDWALPVHVSQAQKPPFRKMSR